MTEHISWTQDNWQHHIKEEGTGFRWTAKYLAVKEGEKPKVLDYGLVTGGVFVAVRNLILKGVPEKWMV